MDNKSVTFSFDSLPNNVAELQALPESSLDTPFKTAALVILALARYEASQQDTIDMLNFLKGPESVNQFQIQFLRDRLSGKQYKVNSFFEGTSPENGYQMTAPYKITVFENPYSYPEANWATLWLKSSGADSMREVKLRCKPSTGQWFMVDQMLLADIRVPAASDPWA